MARTTKINSIEIIKFSISFPKNLLCVIDKMAKADNWNRSNFIAKVFSDFAKKSLKG